MFDGHPLPGKKLSAIVLGDYSKMVNLPEPNLGGSSQRIYGIYRAKAQTLQKEKGTRVDDSQ